MQKFSLTLLQFKKVDYIFVCCLIVLSYTSSYFISSILYLKYKDIPVKVAAVAALTEIDKEDEIDTKMILQKNAFNLDIYNQERLQAQSNEQNGYSGSANNTLSSGGEFKGQLVGILKGIDRAYALIRTDEKFYILAEKEVKDGLTVDSIGIRDVLVIYQGKKYLLKLIGEKNKSEIAPKATNDEEAGTIKKVVSRKDVEENLTDINSLISTMFISPYYLGGEFVGYRIARMRMDAFLRQAGLENGDVLVRMNGERINTPEKMFELFTKWKDASAVTIDIIRRDQKRTVLVEIQ
jgi:general secretion pathway protein C